MGRTPTRACVEIREIDIANAVTERVRRRHRANPAVQLLGSAKSRAKKYGLDFNLSRADIVVPKVCPALGIPLDFSTKDNVPTLDRVIPAKGYVVGNVHVISWRANRVKLNASLVELQGIVEYLKKSLDNHS